MSTKSIAVITGGAGDIGRAIASKLAPTHDIIFLVDIDQGKLSSTLQELQEEEEDEKEKESNPQNNPKFMTHHCDITNPSAVTLMATHISAHGLVHTLINNAGATRVGSLAAMTPAAWQDDISLNLNASYFCFHAFSASLKRSRGCVVNVASVNGLGVYGNPAYSAAKAGMVHFTRSVAVEYGRFGVRANCVAPGTVRTGAWREKEAANPGVFDEVRTWYPLQRAIEPRDVANAVAFLAGEGAAAVTGVCLPVDGGLMAGQPGMARVFGGEDDY